MIFINVILQALRFVHDVYRFFFACKNYSNARNYLFNQILMLDLVNINTNLSLYGDVQLSLQTNVYIFSAVHNLLDSPKICILLYTCIILLLLNSHDMLYHFKERGQ